MDETIDETARLLALPPPDPHTTEIEHPPPPPEIASLSLVVEPSSGPPVRFALPGAGEVTLGGQWAGTSDVLVADPTVSARHARIEVTDGRARIVDLGSRNGTWVGGARVEAAALPVGACAIVGRSTISVEPLGGEPSAFALGHGDQLPGAVGRAPAMLRLAAQVRSYAGLSAPVLVRGESGSGKEVVARALHTLSPRRGGPFVALNLGAIPRELAEAELFGTERGAFTGALEARAGVFELAQGGTLLLDELGELPLDMQAKLLRVLETREIRRLGARTSRPVDVRVVAATWSPLEQRIREGTFREDLFHRVAVLVVEVPPLRARRGDVPAIARTILARCRHELGERVLSPSAASRLSSEEWPGNVRELRNVVYRAAALSGGRVIEAADVARALAKPSSTPPPRPDPRLAQEMVRTHGSVSAAARACGIPRETLRDWVRGPRPR